MLAFGTTRPCCLVPFHSIGRRQSPLDQGDFRRGLIAAASEYGEDEQARCVSHPLPPKENDPSAGKSKSEEMLHGRTEKLHPDSRDRQDQAFRKNGIEKKSCGPLEHIIHSRHHSRNELAFRHGEERPSKVASPELRDTILHFVARLSGVILQSGSATSKTRSPSASLKLRRPSNAASLVEYNNGESEFECELRKLTSPQNR